MDRGVSPETLEGGTLQARSHVLLGFWSWAGWSSAALPLCHQVPGNLSAAQVAAQNAVEAAKNQKAGLGPRCEYQQGRGFGQPGLRTPTHTASLGLSHSLAYQPSSASHSRSGSPLQPDPGHPAAPRAPRCPQATSCFPAQPGLHCGSRPGPGAPCTARGTVHGRCLPPGRQQCREERSAFLKRARGHMGLIVWGPRDSFPGPWNVPSEAAPWSLPCREGLRLQGGCPRLGRGPASQRSSTRVSKITELLVLENALLLLPP